MLKSVLALSALLAGAIAQDSDCVAQSEETFQFCTSAIGTNIYWNYDQEAGFVDIQYEASDNGWKGLGFSSQTSNDQAMPGSNAVLGCFDDLVATDEGADYFLDGRTLNRVNPAGLQELQNYTQTREGALCTIRFLRPIAPASIDMLQRLTNRNQRVIVARGGAQLSQHARSDRVFFDVNFATGESEGAAAALAAPKVLLAMIVASVIAALW